MSATVDAAPVNPRAMQEARLARNFAEYEYYVERAYKHMRQGEPESAAAHAAIASHIAVQNHAGIFWSPRLEKLLQEIGRSLPYDEPLPRKTEIRRILHVGTQAAVVGGLTKLILEWVKADKTREHTLVLTQHRGATPKFVSDIFDGRIHHLNRSPGGQLDWAKRLRRMARDYDLVVLDAYCEDVVPIMAFADPAQHTPVAIMNHADHLFWFGPSIGHICINLRDAAQDLAISRRGVAPERNVLLPTVAEVVKRTRSREEAKRELGIDPNTTLMVSIARQLKYKTLHGITYADIHAPLLEKHPNTSLIVVGAGDPADWAPVRERFGDRIRTTPQIPNPKIYFEAADIYVDSYPFVSSTSIMEAAGYGAPCVSIFNYPDESRIFGINHVALVGNVMIARSLDEYRDIVETLINDPELRARKAAEASAAVARDHNQPGWMSWLENVYARIPQLQGLDPRPMLEEIEQPSFGEPDWRHEDLFGGTSPTLAFAKSYITMLPLPQHLAHWSEMRTKGAFPTPLSAASHLLPEWLKRYVKDGIFKVPEA